MTPETPVGFDLPELDTVKTPADETAYFHAVFDHLEKTIGAGSMRLVTPRDFGDREPAKPANFYQASEISVYFQLFGGCAFKLKHETIELRPGDVLLLDMEKAESEVSNNFGGNDFLNLVVIAAMKYADFHIGCSGRGRLSDRIPHVGPYYRLGTAATLCALTAALAGCCETFHPERDRVCEQLCLALIGYLRRQLVEFPESAPSPEERFRPCRLAIDARTIIVNDAPKQFHTAATLAERLGCSPNYLASCFRRDYRVSIREYVEEMRWELACKLLRRHRLGIAEVAERCGFAYPSYFTRCFRKRFGCLPSNF